MMSLIIKLTFKNNLLLNLLKTLTFSLCFMLLKYKTNTHNNQERNAIKRCWN